MKCWNCKQEVPSPYFTFSKEYEEWICNDCRRRILSDPIEYLSEVEEIIAMEWVSHRFHELKKREEKQNEKV